MAALADIADQPVIALWGDSIRARRIQGERLTFALVELDANADLPAHTHEAEQLGIVIRGSVRFAIDDETRVLGPGGTWRIPSQHPHRAVAGPEGALVIDVFTPVRADWDERPVGPAAPLAWELG